ncbi:MAG: hypothetical protein ACRDDY_10155 [Clostridium sp.]|uniref:hypothetical protein n=1 Tax=Clostridium sp. TaxID=1506 RepID=UPI003EE59C00
MNNNTKTAIYFLITVVCLTYTFYCFSSSVIIGFIISLFVSTFLYYDPKKVKARRERESKTIEN